MQNGLQDLPLSVWSKIVYYLNAQDMQNLLIVNRAINEIIQEYVFHELKLSEWSGSGARFLEALVNHQISRSLSLCIKTLRISFYTPHSISKSLSILPKAQAELRNVNTVIIEAYRSNDAFEVAHTIQQLYPSTKIEIIVQSSAAEEVKSTDVLKKLVKLNIPKLYQSDVQYLQSIETLAVGIIVQNQPPPYTPHLPPLESLSLRHCDYELIGKPSTRFLDMRVHSIQSNCSIDIHDSNLNTLRLVSSVDLPHLKINLNTPCLNALILGNISPLAANNLLSNNTFSSLEFLSISPITVPTLKFLTQCRMHYLKHIVFMIMRASLCSENTYARRREFKKLILCIQNVAARFPVDVIDKSGLLKKSIFYSEGLWRLTSQTKYDKLLQYITPPPLKTR